MKRKYRIVISILCLVCLTFAVAAFAACDDKTEEKTIAYTASTLAEATVGTAYSASVATATGADGITYAVKSGSALPSGLELSSAGAISGTPTAEAANAKFTVVASAEGAASAEAEFTLTVKAEPVTIEGYVMEAEYANLEKMKNIAGSNKPKVFYSADTASNGMYIGDLGIEGNTIEFDFTSTAAGDATVTVMMKSGISSNIEVSRSMMKVFVNSADVRYESVSLPMGATSFTAITIPVTLKEGANVIKFVTVQNTDYVLNGYPVMPHFDCISVKADATLSWTPNTDNEDIY